MREEDFLIQENFYRTPSESSVKEIQEVFFYGQEEKLKNAVNFNNGNIQGKNSKRIN